MSLSPTRALVSAGFAVLVAMTAACGGSQTEAKAPATDVAESTGVGSPVPDLAPDGTSAGSSDSAKNPAPVKTSAVSSTDNGSDIIPPFSSSKSPATTSAKKSTKSGKKSKPKKK
jgi:hypothetical protein